MDLTTKYMGLTLRCPLIASASPLNRDVGTLRQLEDHGVGAVVLPSIFEEEILADGAQDDVIERQDADEHALHVEHR